MNHSKVPVANTDSNHFHFRNQFGKLKIVVQLILNKKGSCENLSTLLINESYPISGQMIMNSTLSPKKGGFFRMGRRNLPKNTLRESFSVLFLWRFGQICRRWWQRVWKRHFLPDCYAVQENPPNANFGKLNFVVD